MLQSASFGKGFCTQKRWFYTKFFVTKKLKEFFHTFIGEKNIFENNVWDFYFSPFFLIVIFFLLSIKRLSRTFSYYLRLLKRVSFLVIFFPSPPSYFSLWSCLKVSSVNTKGVWVKKNCQHSKRTQLVTIVDIDAWLIVGVASIIAFYLEQKWYIVCVCVSLFYW